MPDDPHRDPEPMLGRATPVVMLLAWRAYVDAERVPYDRAEGRFGFWRIRLYPGTACVSHQPSQEARKLGDFFEARRLRREPGESDEALTERARTSVERQEDLWRYLERTHQMRPRLTDKWSDCEEENAYG